MWRAGSDENLSGKPKLPSEKHDVLFSKARYVLNQRHIKRPWFNLNPFLEKTDENIDLDNFFPGESKYIQPLESLVLCESFHNEKPVDTRELSIDSFFPYLFSSKWDNGCSLRVLEGQLLEELLLGLYRLENEGTAVRHTTRAFARNHHPKTGSYKTAGRLSETLLIEFAHFGRLIKEQPNRKTLDAFEYLKLDKSEDVATDPQTTPILTKEAEIPANYKRKGIETDISKKTKRVSSTTSSDQTQKAILKPLITKHIHTACFLKAINPDIKQQAYPVLPPIQQSSRRSLTSSDSKAPRTSNLISGSWLLSGSRRNVRQSHAVPQSSMDRQLAFKYMDQKSHEKSIAIRSDSRRSSRYTCKTRNLKAGKEARILSLDLDDDSISEENCFEEEEKQLHAAENKDIFFGEEFYLSDYKGNCKHYYQNSEEILKQKRGELRERRDVIKSRKELEAKYRSTCKLPELPKLDNDKIEAYRMHNETIKMPDEVPTLEEFTKLLKNDEYYDPRYKDKKRVKCKRIAERYYRAKEMYRSPTVYKTETIKNKIRSSAVNVLSSSKLVSSTVCEMTDIKKEENKRHHIRLPALYHSYGAACKILKLPEIRRPESSTAIHKRGLEVLGVTDSEQCKDHFIQYRGKRQTKANFKDESYVSSKGPMFPKITLVSDDDIESLDTESNESFSAEKLSESFDTNKLNMRYSIERIRKKRRSKLKKKNGFIGVLAKYYNVKTKQNAFTQGISKDTKIFMKREKPVRRKKIEGKQSENEKEMVIGKMKNFKFLSVKQRKKLNLESLPRGDFSSSNLTKFHRQLKEALNMFVVRREIVVSDLKTFHNATTTVTFTKNSCFQQKEKNTRKP